MRLQYARLKVEHGWQRQNLNEVENLYFHHSAMKSRPKPVQRVPTLRLPEPAQPTQSTSLSSSASKNAAGTPSAPANSASSGNAVDASSPTQDPPVPPTPVLPPSGLSQTLSPSTSQLSRPPSQPSRPSATSASETGRSMAGSSTTPAPGPAVAAELARLPTHPTQASSNFGPSTPTYQPLSRTATEVLSPFAPQSSTFSTFPPPSASSSFTSQSTFVSPSPFSPAVIPIPGMSSFPSNISSTQSLATYGPGPHPFTSSFTVTNGSFSSGQGPPQTFRPTKMFDIPTAPPPPPSSNGSGLMGSTSAPVEDVIGEQREHAS
ncbi:hypothetical protein OF83DRAFT_1149920 [Amylostereum chailletii]|nr:hypothetical protein OF83DRAFT_1149920 [Amylostereum chailletii]